MECGNALSPPPERASSLWPPDLLLAVALVLTAAGALLVGLGIWVWGTLALLLAGAVFFVRWEAGRLAARPAVTGAWSRLSAQRARLRARSRGQLELFRARRELAELNAERSRGYHELGRVTHAGDTSAADAARALLDDVAARIEAKEIEIADLVRKIDERVRTVAGQAAPSPTLETPPEPARIPTARRRRAAGARARSRALPRADAGALSGDSAARAGPPARAGNEAPATVSSREILSS
jgi:hypothetical protein